MLKIGCILAAIAGIGLITATVLGIAIDTSGITTAGIIAAISAGAIVTVAWVALIVNWYQKRAAPQEEEQSPSAEEKPKPSSSKS